MKFRWPRTLAVFYSAVVATVVAVPAGGVEAPNAGTFSIVAYDAEGREWGIAVASKVLAAGYIAPWAKAGVGAAAIFEGNKTASRGAV